MNTIEPPAKRVNMAARLLPVERVLVDDDAAGLDATGKCKRKCPYCIQHAIPPCIGTHQATRRIPTTQNARELRNLRRRQRFDGSPSVLALIIRLPSIFPVASQTAPPREFLTLK